MSVRSASVPASPARPAKMKALRKTRPAPGAELVEVPLRAIGPREVLIRVEVAAICGSDGHVYGWGGAAAPADLSLPFTMGHEFSGEVMEVGAQVTSLKLGDRVAGETHYPCGQCYQCQTGEQHICANMRLVGRTLDGCFADYCVLPEICARKIPDCIPSRQAALLEPLGVAVHAVTEAQVWGRPVVILGAGPIGLMAVAAARQLGAAQVIATARTPVKLEKALAMGATAALNPRTEDVVKEVLRATGGVGAGAVIDFTGDPEALVQGFRMLRKGGRVVLVAAFGELSGLDSLRDIIWKEAKITGIHGRRMFDTWILAEGLLVSQSVDVSPVTGSTYPLEGFEAAFAEATGSTGRVLLVP